MTFEMTFPIWDSTSMYFISTSTIYCGVGSYWTKDDLLIIITFIYLLVWWLLLLHSISRGTFVCLFVCLLFVCLLRRYYRGCISCSCCEISCNDDLAILLTSLDDPSFQFIVVSFCTAFQWDMAQWTLAAFSSPEVSTRMFIGRCSPSSVYERAL